MLREYKLIKFTGFFKENYRSLSIDFHEKKRVNDFTEIVLIWSRGVCNLQLNIVGGFPIEIETQIS